ncbi:unnamed protein product [Phyllotreta striolata]|uniref:Hypoxia-inducible factor 1-alpha n=1 Tax=Phyllotreta striolata TaxID=444603 RepID=A0A9N9U026_PHYSR|nr:unnamed protein product [Phyllotreta striolata]
MSPFFYEEDFGYLPRNFDIQSDECAANLPKLKPDGLLAKLGVPCQTNSEHDYGQCFGYYQNGRYNMCQFVENGDIEDFMNNEKRKERSRNAARCRRSKESELYCSLASCLPFANDQPSQLDKASVMRLAISYLKIRNMVGSVSELNEENKSVPEDGSYFLKTLEGFVMILSEDGDFIYLSENVSEYLGINQIDLMGQNIFEYSHPCDHDEIKEMLSGKCTEDNFKSIFIRMKCTLTTKGRSVTLKSAVYKVIHSTGHVMKYRSGNDDENSEQGESKTCYISVNQPIPHPSNIESPLPKQTFLTKHNMDMKFTHADDEFMKEILGYEPDDLLGKSVFEYYHAIDMDCILSSYKCLFSKGQCQTGQYRFLAKSGGYVWLITQATLINDKNQKPQSVVCVNYVVSGLECKDEVYSTEQYLNVQSSPKIVVQKADNNNNNNNDSEEIDDEENDVKSEIDVERTKSSVREPLGSLNDSEQEGCNCGKPISATSSIFAPRTEDMNKGFLTFSDEEPGLTMLKDEPEDLTHLAPVAGDVCVPLEDHPFLPEMLDDILLRDNFCPLLSNAPSDPFMSYRDFQDPSPQLLSPNLSKHSDCSLTSLNSPCDSLMDDDASAFMNLPIDDVDLLKSPYTSMNISDDLPLLISNDLMWNTGEKKYLRPGGASSLAQLLTKRIQTGERAVAAPTPRGAVDDAEQERDSKNVRKSWTDRTNVSSKSARDRSHCNNKRSNTSALYEFASKKTRCNDPKDGPSSELLHQLISNNVAGKLPKDGSRDNGDWLLNGNVQKAACVSQPSESVLMNLLGDSTNDIIMKEQPSVPQHLRQINQDNKRHSFRKLLDPDASSIASLMDLTQQDFEVNAPVEKYLLQGVELLRALDANTAAI